MFILCSSSSVLTPPSSKRNIIITNDSCFFKNWATSYSDLRTFRGNRSQIKSRYLHDVNVFSVQHSRTERVLNITGYQVSAVMDEINADKAEIEYNHDVLTYRAPQRPREKQNLSPPNRGCFLSHACSCAS